MNINFNYHLVAIFLILYGFTIVSCNLKEIINTPTLTNIIIGEGENNRLSTNSPQVSLPASDLIFSCFDRIYQYGFIGNETKLLTSDRTRLYSDINIIGDWVYFLRSTDLIQTEFPSGGGYGPTDIFRMKLDGTEFEQITKDKYQDLNLISLPENSELIYVSDRIESDNSSERYKIVFRDLEIQTEEVLLQSAGELRIITSPSKKKILIASTQNNENPKLYLLDTNSKFINELISNQNIISGNFTWSSDEKYIVFSTKTEGYNIANQLMTAQIDNSTILWEYQYDSLGRLTEVLPNGNRSNGAKQYTYNSAGYLIQTKLHDGSDYQLQAEMQYDGLGQRLSMTGYAFGTSITTQYVLDPLHQSRPLLADSNGNVTAYVYGIEPIADHTTAWAYSLTDGTGTARQLVNENGEITLTGTYTPWGDTLEYNGTGNFTFGYFGGLMDAATGLIYIGNGQYYDPSTGRLLTRDTQPNKTNPYVPWGDPSGALFVPIVLIGLLYGKKRKKNNFDYLVITLLLVFGVGMSLSACGPVPPENPINTPDLPTPIITIIHPPTETPLPTSTPDSNKCGGYGGCTVYLTFDDGPDPLDFTTDIAYKLQERGVKATFFVTGADEGENGLLRYLWTCLDTNGITPEWKGQNAIQALMSAGHKIGLHGWYHKAWNQEYDQGLSQLTIEESRLNEIGVLLGQPVLVRSPYLAWGEVPIPNYKNAYYYAADIISGDTESNYDPKNIVDSIKTQLASQGYPNGPIILLHSVPSTRTYQTIVNPASEETDLIAQLINLGYTRFEVLPRDNDALNTIIGKRPNG
jgi:RHS repeat-associated protein